MNNVKKSIGWCDYTVNPVKGLCPVGCSYCYARAMYKRFKMDEQLTFHPEAFDAIEKLKEPSRIFVGSTMELFGEWITDHVLHSIFNYVEHYKQHTFIFLTKRPENLIKWSPFPENVWVGTSITSAKDCILRLSKMANVEASVKFISFEPLLKPISTPNQLYMGFKLSGISWLIIGQQTPVKQSTMPKIEWVREIVLAADMAGIPVFLKDNLQKLFIQNIDIKGNGGYFLPEWARHITSDGRGELRQEFPKG